MSVVRILATPPAAPTWTDRLGNEGGGTWARLERLLLGGGRWKPHQVVSLATESARVLRHLRDPLSNAPFQGRGLVVGYVQSGKTANYTAVTARAVDAGYRLVIVLSGIHDALRSQTQIRLERELTGPAADDPNAANWTLLTTVTEDFQGADPSVLDRPGTFIAVVKKNVAILEKLDRWLRDAGHRLDTLPALVIDDEADQASINTRGNRPPDPAVDDDDDDETRTGPGGPSSTNALIRRLLSRLPKATYVAYTATPFANILIDPNAVDRKVGKDLFPHDFALQLARPEGYTGTEELFGVSAQGRDVFRAVPDADVGALRRTNRRRTAATVLIDAPAEILPNSLSDAVVTFCLAGAIRTMRPGLGDQPHTMLVHVSARVDDQARIAAAIREQRELWRQAILQGQNLDGLFREALDAHLAGVWHTEEPEAVIRAAITVMRQLEVLELNSATGENLEYDTRPGRHIIAVGGNRLSRGLTLEGLTVSYFLRTATMADTLLQMARWYGFRTGYEDLIRIWTTDGIAHWFTELALVEQSLRDSLRTLARAGRRPSEMAIRLRAHSGLLLTARNKSGMAAEVQDSWSAEHPQTVILPLKNPDRLAANRALTDRFLHNLGTGHATTGGWLMQDLPPEVICDFLRRYRTHDDVVAFRGDALADWIMTRSEDGELTDWSVFLAGSQQGRRVPIGPHVVGLVTRSPTSSESIGILIDPRHEGVDIPGGPESFRRASGNYDAEAMRTARPPTQGLLIIYPLDPEPFSVTETDAVIGLALSFPRTSDGASTSILNRGVVDE